MRDRAAEGAKRKRTLTNGMDRASSRRRTQTPADSANDSDQYDPDQPLEERRRVQRDIRHLMKDLDENREEYLQADSLGLHETLRKADKLAAGVKQTTEATIDSRLLVHTVDASWRKTLRLTSGAIAQGVDVDEFVSKCVTYMRLGGGIEGDDAPELSSTQRQRRQPPARGNTGPGDDDEVDDDDDMYNWEHLGRFACLPNICRPATPGFLLGPLSVEKKIRKITKRSAPFRPGNLQEARPEVLEAKDIQKNEDNDLASICTKILRRLVEVQEGAQDAAEEAHDKEGLEASRAVMQKHGLRENGGIDFCRFVVNPKSFGQTIENMFYVSFLIRDAKIELDYDEAGLPTLCKLCWYPFEPREYQLMSRYSSS
jgi:hypothetical protein